MPIRSRKSKSAAPARGAPVVEAVFNATYEEIVRVGYGGLSIEEVAARAGVNKTTVYRRWPTKEDLTVAAFGSLPAKFGTLPNAGSFRGDLIEAALSMDGFMRTLAGRALMRLALFEVGVPTRPEFERIEAAWNAHSETQGLEAIVNRAIARGELSRRFDRRVLIDALGCTISVRSVSEEGPPDPDFLERLIDGLLLGLLPRDEAGQKKPIKKKKRAPRG